MRALLTVLPLAASLTLAVLGTAAASPVGTTWTLQSIQVPGGVPITPGPALARPTLRLETSGAALRVSGSTGCSPLTGAGTLKGQALLLRGLQGGSSATCPDAALSLREDYLSLLARTTRFEQSGSTLTLVAGGGLLTFTGGAVTSSSAAAALDGSYVARRLILGGQDVPLLGLLGLTVSGPQLAVTGVVGCNTLRAAGTRLGSGQFQFVALAGTRMLCSAPQAQAEQALTTLLRGPLTPALSGTTLTLTGAAGTLTLTRSATGAGPVSPAPVSPAPVTPPAAPAVSGTYRLKLLDGQAAPPTFRPVTLTLDGGRVGGTDGCNSLGGAYSLKGGRLLVDGPLISTRMMCPEDQTLPLLSALEGGPTLRVSGRTLTLSAEEQTWVFEKE
ncbi:META domain-containing protein [Deinococcus sp. HMF7620]|uniref:META domain-containing protein n=1 Tax=Deinococcus arboris TaxID=2682977 RepID=A0A7C9IA10_9DEIO|nr:META domain-containing protein [Deinococcus arboris]MVN86526.1 META domain-containing protein [Deinococcus arboris]